MARKISVEVTFHEQDIDPLTVPPSQTTIDLINDDDWVAWSLKPAPGATLPSDATLFVHFAQYLGPFQAIRNVSRSVVIAKGNTGALLTFPYFLFVLREDGTILKTQTLNVVNQSMLANTSPLATVTFVPDPLPGQPLHGNLVIQPRSLLLHEGDIAQWQVVGPLPDNHLMAFNFAPSDTLDDPVGPFRDFFLKPAGAGSQRAGAGKFIADQAETITYHIEVWSEDGLLVASDDPTIDGLGKPPNT